MLESFKCKGIKYKDPPNSTQQDSDLISHFQKIGSQNNADAVGDKLIGKSPVLVKSQAGGKSKKKIIRGGKCKSYGCPDIEYASGSSSDQAINSLNKEQINHVNITNKMEGNAKPNQNGGVLKSNILVKNKISNNNIMKTKYKTLPNHFKGGNYPVDVSSSVSPSNQWSNPYVSSPPPSYNGGLYGASIGQDPLTANGPQFNGPWGNVPVTPTTTNMINKNLVSAEPPPGATEQYIGTNRQGNNFTAMPGINWYNTTNDSNPGPFNLKGPTNLKGGKKKSNKKRKSAKQLKGGLSLYSSNMDCGAPFHPTWKKGYLPEVAATSRDGMNSYTFIQDGGKNSKKTNKKSIKRKSKTSKNKKLKGGLSLYSSNMDCGAPFHPTWKKGYQPEVAATSRDGMNSYTFIQEGGKKQINKTKKTKKKQNGGLAQYSSNMDCGAPFHSTWNKTFVPPNNCKSRPNMNSYTFIQDGGKPTNTVIQNTSNTSPTHEDSITKFLEWTSSVKNEDYNNAKTLEDLENGDISCELESSIVEYLDLDKPVYQKQYPFEDKQIDCGDYKEMISEYTYDFKQELETFLRENL